GVQGCDTGLVARGIKVERLVLFLAVRSIETHAHTQVQGQLAGDVEVVLEVRLQNLVAVVILDALILLTKAGDPAEKQVDERISGRNGVGRVEGQVPGNRAGAQFSAQFILLPGNSVRPQLQIVLADNLADVIAVRVGWIAIVGSIRNVTYILSEPTVVSIANKLEARKNPVAVASEEVSEGGVGGTLPDTHVIEDDVVGCVTENKFV